MSTVDYIQTTAILLMALFEYTRWSSTIEDHRGMLRRLCELENRPTP